MILTKEQVVAELAKRDILGDGRVVFKVIDYSDNRLAPEKTAYQVHYTDYTGKRRKVTYYPNTVGFQWSK